jgi:hypothetical protein
VAAIEEIAEVPVEEEQFTPEPEPEMVTYEEPEPVLIQPIIEITDNTPDESSNTGKYTIQFMASAKRIDMDYLEGKYKVEIQEGTDEYYRYITGVFNTIEDAKNLHREIANTKYKDAFIRLHNLNDYLNRSAGNSAEVYTIQIMALKKETNPETFGALDNIKVSYGRDGWYRYTVGEFNSVASARSALKDVISRGFKDAYVRKISDVSNYR